LEWKIPRHEISCRRKNSNISTLKFLRGVRGIPFLSKKVPREKVSPMPSRAVERGDESALPVLGKGGCGRAQREAFLLIAHGYYGTSRTPCPTTGEGGVTAADRKRGRNKGLTWDKKIPSSQNSVTEEKL